MPVIVRWSENHTAQGPDFHVLKETISWFQQMLLVLHRWCDLRWDLLRPPLPPAARAGVWVAGGVQSCL